ncbi:unnamed protein product [Candida verbasci]|uniref:Bromo domain-containing protein n=1 Tax=Candida verbasci TaxID=1227364 RepID=A0A9W4XBP9_9ASCO|nr:unnamed protein product [Candida verbasci]
MAKRGRKQKNPLLDDSEEEEYQDETEDETIEEQGDENVQLNVNESVQDEKIPQQEQGQPQQQSEEGLPDDFEDPPTPSDKNNDDDYDEDEDEDEDIKPRKKQRVGRRRGASKKHIEDEDDEFFDDGNESDEDDLLSEEEKFNHQNFIVIDEEDDYVKPKKRLRRGRPRSESLEPRRFTRSGRSLEEESHDDSNREEVDLRQEVADLYDSSPMNDNVHKLRQRAKVDYTIPPPITNDLQLAQERGHTPIASKGRRGRPALQKSDFRNILYPTAGPFGGSDVISLFGKNIPPGGISLPGLTNTNNLTAIGQNISDSDTSDDEIRPVNGEATVSKKKPRLLTTGGSNDDKKKKNNLSDTDPLGVDMNIDFSVVGGLDNYINQLKEMVALPLLYPELYQNFGITPPRGVLFHGPPGTGKTLMARALAASCSSSDRKITFFMRKGADCLSKWVGEAERQLRLLFEEAKNQQPAIIFFDEIDGLAPVRSSKQEQIHASIVSTLLALMDGMDNRGQIIVIGATNRPDAIDPALRRPGRFDREFYFPLPDLSSRKQILKIHTRKWTPQLPDIFLEKLAELTKGYGGADLRALCTEAALNSIQRKYPQIYLTNDKLQVNPSKVKVIAKDFMKAIEKIVPSSARSTSSGSAPLPEHLKPLLQKSFDEIVYKLNNLLPNSIGHKKLTALDEAKYLDPTINDEDSGFTKQQLLKTLENLRICRPHLLISGEEGNGQQYLSAAVLNHLEGFQVQSLDLGNMFGDTTKTPESSIVQAFIEARRNQPSIIFLPNIDIWFQVLPDPARATLTSLLRGLKSNEKVLLLGISETSLNELSNDIKLIFGFESTNNNVSLHKPTNLERRQYFATLESTLLMKPFEFINDLENRPKRKLKQLKVVKAEEVVKDNEKKIKEQEYQDTKLKNVLKIKLAGLMDLFKVRYKRFKKPIIDENFLHHLFDATILENPFNNYQVLYEKSTDPKHENMILELSSGKYYYNMDLDTIEERLWNGYYSEPKQFLKDVKMIVKDSVTFGDRERLLKANEMLTNAQFGIDDFSTPDFLKACKEVKERETEKQKRLLKEHEKLVEQLEKLKESEAQAIVIEDGENENKEPQNNVENGSTGNGENEKGTDKTGTESENVRDHQVLTEVAQEHDVSDTTIVTEEPQLNGKIESDSESEAEEELDIDLTKEVIIDPQQLSSFNQNLNDITQDFNIEKLEFIMARLMDIIWQDRSQWDKTNTLRKLNNQIKSLEVG